MSCHVEVFTRVTGFFRPTFCWNEGKKSEYNDRKTFKLGDKGEGKGEGNGETRDNSESNR